MRIRGASDFEALLDAVAHDTLDAHHHRKLYVGLTDARAKYEVEIAQTPAFWSMTILAHGELVLQRLTRLYDEREDSLSLLTFLRLIDSNLELFDKHSFRQRLRRNPFVKSLAAHARRPDTVQLAEDIRSVRGSDPTVTKLRAFRNKAFVHRDPKTILGMDLQHVGPLTWAEAEGLINRARIIVNRYSSLFRASSYAENIVGHDDYLDLLRMVRRRLQDIEAEIIKELPREAP